MTREPVTILILTFNRSRTLMQTISSIRENTRYPYRILIRDHNSDDGHRLHNAQLSGKDCAVQFHSENFSCAEGRRMGLDDIKTCRVVFLDDDIKVSPLWLTELTSVMMATKASVVPANLLTDYNAGITGRPQVVSGCRRLTDGEVRAENWGYVGPAQLCHGGATLYETDMLRRTQYRAEYKDGFEDWDQSLQITRNLDGTIWGSHATLFHMHRAESRQPAYWDRRWRWDGLLKAAIAIWERWGIRTGVRNTYAELMRRGHNISQERERLVLEILGENGKKFHKSLKNELKQDNTRGDGQRTVARSD